jgi:hypothetical protein
VGMPPPSNCFHTPDIDHTRTKVKSAQTNDYVSHCTLIPGDTMPSASWRVDSLTPCALRGGLLPGDSYKESFLSL